ncbi:MAG TPA: hypothetical protein IAC64_05105 [Candidatus Caccomorpha excrementavium]|nr:hypothetical protein [Candidatus Caccomorpha excrementavium]
MTTAKCVEGKSKRRSSDREFRPASGGALRAEEGQRAPKMVPERSG